MFETITPEQAGISLVDVAELIKVLENSGCVTHDILLMKGDKIFAEYYWKPFHKDFLHRQYSQTKSFVGIAIGLLIDDGKLNLDDLIVSHFPEKIDADVPEYLSMQTVRDMLTMCTCGGPPNWFTSNDLDRTHLYLNQNASVRKPGVRWGYDSAGSQVLCALVEKLAEMPMLDFLKQRIFNEMGTFQTARMLKCKNDDSWGDSAMLCTARDMASFGRFVMNYGKWNGKQLLSEAYVREATSALVNNDEFGFGSFFRQGYGYQIWRTREGFAFVGMGDQLTYCIPEKDLIFVINSDNQGHPGSRAVITAAFYDKIVDRLVDHPLPSSDQPVDVDELKLAALKGQSFSPMMKKIDGITYICKDNKAGIAKFSFVFNEKGGEWHYTNAQGDKVLPFYWNENCFGKFPQDGYSTEHGGLRNTEGYRYDCATSAAWCNDYQMMLRCQIIDEYFGNFSVRFAFKGAGADVVFSKNAEDFLTEYIGVIHAQTAHCDSL